MNLFNQLGIPELVTQHAKILPVNLQDSDGEYPNAAHLYVFTTADLIAFVGAVQMRTSDYVFDRLRTTLFTEPENGTQGSDAAS
ncbi:hypothetical protein [Phage DSL-LC04]|jgi:hypothetical protein|nr:hypothetical protein [Phage DSL-LC04]